MSQVVNVRVAYIRPEYQNLKDWCEDPNNVYIGRKGIVFVDGARYPTHDSVWANPYKLNDMTREESLEKYKNYIQAKINNNEVDIEELRGKTLGCWCKPQNCHGDILKEILENK